MSRFLMFIMRNLLLFSDEVAVQASNFLFAVVVLATLAAAVAAMFAASLSATLAAAVAAAFAAAAAVLHFESSAC